MSVIMPDIDIAPDFLNTEDIIGIPTEKVYGLAGNIYCKKAIKKIFELKNRPFFNPLIVHIDSMASLYKVAVGIPDVALKLAGSFWSGPLTILLNKHRSVPDLVTGAKATIAIRIPNHPVALSLLKRFNSSQAVPSAKPFGSASPTSTDHVAEYFKDELQIILDGGVCQKGIESTIIGFQNSQAILYRLGSISIERIEAVIDNIAVADENESAPDGPGMLCKHYAPVFLTSDVQEAVNSFPDRKIGLLLFDREITGGRIINL
jgi:L-threonylcarbamoyladenylate synthase